MTGFAGYGEGWISDTADPRLALLWPGSIDYEDELAFVLYVAQIQCEEFAPVVETVPENYVAAQVLQARALVRAGIAGDGDKTGIDYTVTVFPMDWTVKNLLRPKRGKPYFGKSAA